MAEQSDDLINHLSELRRRLILLIGCFFLTLCGGLYVSPQILRYIKSQPSAISIEWNVFSFTDGLFIYIRCAFIFAALLTIPVLLYQLWAFIRPGLTEKEARGTLLYVPTSFLLFLSGISFAYFLIFPMMLNFMKTMNQSIGAVETYGIDRYFSFLFNLVFPLGIAFEMPLIILFLTRLGLLNPDRLRITRKYAYVGLAIIGSCISPPDFVSHLSVTIPLIVLFEVSVLVSVRYYKKMNAVPTHT
jgi:sec-independent protein translocase protein TatC